MYQRPKCLCSYFSLALQFNFRVLFPCEYPQNNLIEIMKKSEEQKIIGIIVDNKLNFKSHVRIYALQNIRA